MDDRIKTEFTKIANALGWSVSFSNGNPGVHAVARDGIKHRFGYLSSYSESEYRAIANSVELVFVSSMSYRADRIAKNAAVYPSSDFLYVMTDWNMKAIGIELPVFENKPTTHETIRIIEENPLQQIYTHLRSLTSTTVVNQAVRRHAEKECIILDSNVINAKAEGVTYLVQNAIDYYDSASVGNMTQRLLNLYYGTIALMEAEMLISGDQYKNLSEIEAITSSGHGMTTFGDAKSLREFYVGVMDRGLFQAWLSHRGIDVSGFAPSRQKAEKSEYVISLDDLFRHIPELQDIMQETEEDYKPYFLFPYYDSVFNHTTGLNGRVYEPEYPGSYISFLNREGKTDLEWEKELIEGFLTPFTITGVYQERKSTGWRTYICHPDGTHLYECYHTHKGMNASMVISPLFGRTDDWEVFAVMILYALSIIVRYLPNLWTRIMHGDLDYCKALLYQFSRVAERELTQIFLEKLTGKKLMLLHPQSMI